MVQPRLIVQIPVNGTFQSLLKGDRGAPIQFPFDLVRVNGIPEVMARTVLYKGDQFFRTALGSLEFLVHQAAEQFDQTDVLPLIEAPNIIGFPDPSFMEYRINGPSMVQDIQPVPGVVSVPVNGQGPVVDDVVYEQGDELFREL